MQKVIQTSQGQTSENEEEKSMSLQEVFHVNLSPSQAKGREQRVTVISGLICSEPYTKSDPIGLLVKTLLASLRWYSPARRLKWEVSPLYSERVSLYLKDDSNMLLKPSAVILNVKDIPSSRYLYRLVASVRPTAGIGFGLLPTVTAQDYKLRAPNNRQQELPEIIRGVLLPTPLATEIHHPERVHRWKQAHAFSIHRQIDGGEESQRPERFSGLLRSAIHSGSQRCRSGDCHREKRQGYCESNGKGTEGESERTGLEYWTWENGRITTDSESQSGERVRFEQSPGCQQKQRQP